MFQVRFHAVGSCRLRRISMKVLRSAIMKYIQYAIGESVDCGFFSAGIDEIAVTPILHVFLYCLAARRHNRHSVQHRLDNGSGEALVTGCEREDRRSGHKAANVQAETECVKVGCQYGCLKLCVKPLA